MKKYKKDVKDIMVTGMGLSVGSRVMGDMGADASVLAPVGRGLGMAGRVSSLGMVTRQLDKVMPKKNKKNGY